MSNQASEDELRQSLATLFYDDSYEYMLSRPDLFDVGAIDAVVDLIRTEKIKAQIDILQEGVSESKEFCGEDVDINLGWVNFKLNQLQQLLTKLEAGL